AGLPHLAFDGRSRAEVSARAHWKLAAVEEHAADRPLAWIDDAFNDACHAWAARREAPTLLVATEPATGLREAPAAELRAWAKGRAAWGSEPGGGGRLAASAASRSPATRRCRSGRRARRARRRSRCRRRRRCPRAGRGPGRTRRRRRRGRHRRR